MLDHNVPPNEIVRLTPVSDSLKWSYRMGNVGGPGDFSCDFSLFQTSDPSNPSSPYLITPDCFAPYATDYAVYMYLNGTPQATAFLSGICTGANLQTELGVVSFTGKDFLHWLEQPYPFTEFSSGGNVGYDLTLTQWLALLDTNRYWSADAGTNTTNVTFNATQETVITDLIASLTSQVDYDVNAPQLVPVFTGAAWTETLNYSIMWGDSTNVLDHMRAISHLYDPRGFDFWMDPFGVIQCNGPRTLNPSSVTPIATLNNATIMAAIDWTNNGPLATDTIVFGSGTGNGRPWVRGTPFAPSVALYRRWAREVNIANPGTALTSKADVVTGLANAQAYLDRFPQKDLQLRIHPEALISGSQASGFLTQIGEAVFVDYTFPNYHRIDASFFITGQFFSFDAAGNPLCDLTLDQIYT